MENSVNFPNSITNCSVEEAGTSSLNYWNSLLVSLDQCFLNCGPWPAVEPTSPGNLLQMQILWHHHRSTELEIQVGASMLYLTRLPSDSEQGKVWKPLD